MASNDPSQQTPPKFQADTSADVSTAAKKQGPGSRLAAAREASHMAVSEVASLLRLDSAVIRALEADDIGKLPSATFIKGYLRSYARLVALDGEELVRDYDELVGPTIEAIKPAAIVSDDTKGLGRWFWLILALAVIIMIAWYWSKPGDVPVSTDTLRSDQQLNAENVQIVADEAPKAEAMQIKKAPLNSNEAETADEVIEQLLKGLKDAPVTTALAANEALTESASSSDSLSSEAGLTKTQAAASVVSDISAEIEAEAALETDGVDWLTLTLSGQQDSWISIRDAREQRVYRDLMKAGQSKQVRGKAPLLVHFGNAEGVQLSVNGQLFDHTAWHKPDGTVRFVVKPQ